MGCFKYSNLMLAGSIFAPPRGSKTILNVKDLAVTSGGDCKLIPGPRVMARVAGTCKLGVCASASVINLIWATATKGMLVKTRAMIMGEKNKCIVKGRVNIR